MTVLINNTCLKLASVSLFHHMFFIVRLVQGLTLSLFQTQYSLHFECAYFNSGLNISVIFQDTFFLSV